MVHKKNAERRSFLITIFELHSPRWCFKLLDLCHHIRQRMDLSGLLLFAEAERVQHECAFEQLNAEGRVHAFGAGL